jgi:hypothetical protein
VSYLNATQVSILSSIFRYVGSANKYRARDTRCEGEHFMSLMVLGMAVLSDLGLECG